MKLISTLIAVAAPAALALSVGVAEARENIVITGDADALTRSQQVQLSGIDLATSDGQSLLAHRVRLAVREVCAHDGEHRLALLPCKRGAWEDARPQIANAIERARANPGLAMTGYITVRAGL